MVDVDDGRVNQNGPLSSATSDLIDGLGSLLPEPSDPSMTELAQAYPFRNPTNIVAMARGEVTPGLQALANRAEAIQSKEGTPGQVRVQLQVGKRNISSISMASPSGSVSKLQAEGGLAWVYIDALSKDPSLAANPGFHRAIISAGQQVRGVPPGGASAGGNAIRKPFVHKGQVYRVDIEIHRGTAFLE